jgi:type I restriction-modification system DNA methylase subunit
LSVRINVNRVRDLLQEFAFHDLFIEELGWQQPLTKKPTSVSVGSESYRYKGIAHLSGIEVFEVTSSSGDIPPRKAQAGLSKEIAKHRLEHVLILVDNKRTQSVWYWVKREGDRRQPREHYYFKGQPGDLFISKIASMSVDLSELDESGHLPLVEAAKKVQKALDVERVIKRFYRQYDKQRIEFTKLIEGIPGEKDRRWYASVLLNRLMFIYFLQKKFFIDNGDEWYLQNKLADSKARGPDRYYSEFLDALFFEAFAKPEGKRTQAARDLTGQVKYLNGGLFLPHKLEQMYDIYVPDRAFEGLLQLFSDFTWNLNDIPGESDDDINPDVLGYIFEKYINQKEFGAYYTRPEITEYLCEQTIYRLILDRTNELAVDGAFAPRQHESVPELLIHLDKLTARRLLREILPGLSILDPAVGSGAFLVAALKTLITVYSAVVGWLHFHDEEWLDRYLRSDKMHTTLDKVQYAIKKAIITDNLYGVDIMEEATEIAKLRLFMTLVASTQTVEDLEPLPNIDFNILAGNSLIGLMRVADAEFEAKQVTREKTGSLFAPTKTYRQILTERNRKVDLYRHTGGYIADLTVMRDAVQEIEDDARPVLSSLLQQKFDGYGISYEQATWDEKAHKEGKPKRRAVSVADIEDLKPLHWGFEFDRILNLHGGFDAIITNPPWEALRPQDKEFFMEHSDLVTKNKMTITEFDEKKSEFLEDHEVRTAYLDYLTRFRHESAYFRAAHEYENQSAIVGGKKTGTDANLYKLFVERAFSLLCDGGLCGIVVPSGIYTDLGATGLRRMLFAESKITGLFCFENRKEVFEGVHRSFKFVLLSYRKGGSTTAFPAAFMRHDVGDLSRFPASIGMTVTLDNVRSFAPETLSIMETKSPAEVAIASKMSHFPRFGDAVIGTWRVRLMREFDMTLDKELFEYEPGEGRLALYEGKMMHQFTHQFAQPTRWIDEKRGRMHILGRATDCGQICDYQRYRVAHRAIARSNDERTMIATILPRNVFYGNSLYASRDANPGSIELFTCAVLDSFAIDYYLRQMVSANLNLNFIYQLPIPRLTMSDAAFAPIVRRAARLVCTTPEFADLWNEVDLDIGLDTRSPNPKLGKCRWTPACGATAPHQRAVLRSELDGLIANLYGLSEEEFRHVLSTFTLVDSAVRDAALAAFRAVQSRRIL